MRLVVLSGGVGGARMADGFARILPRESLAVVVNTGDDFEWHGCGCARTWTR
jgi:LPPG:FO 2-phospho-L-lactate transferase (EC 2.7.1.-)